MSPTWPTSQECPPGSGCLPHRRTLLALGLASPDDSDVDSVRSASDQASETLTRAVDPFDSLLPADL